MQIRVLFFGRLRDIAGRSEDLLETPEPIAIGKVFDYYAERYPALRELRASTLLARNEEFTAPATMLADRDVVALLPPVSGGAGNIVMLTREPISSSDLARQVAAGSDGAVITFEGIVRNNTKGRATRYLEYECYESMALKMMQDLTGELAAKHAVGRMAMVHRLGRMEIGEASVVIIVAAPHRKAAYEASRDAIDTLKRTVPIWKKEFFEDGEVWVDGEWDERLRAHAT